MGVFPPPYVLKDPLSSMRRDIFTKTKKKKYQKSKENVLFSLEPLTTGL